MRLWLAGGALEAEKETAAGYTVTIPGEVTGLGMRLRIETGFSSASETDKTESGAGSASRAGSTAILRNWRPGDRVLLRHSSGPRKVKEVLERLRVAGLSRRVWPVLEVDGRIVWMKGVEVEPARGIRIEEKSLEAGGAGPAQSATSAED